jgi:hypothetical protein
MPGLNSEVKLRRASEIEGLCETDVQRERGRKLYRPAHQQEGDGEYREFRRASSGNADRTGVLGISRETRVLVLSVDGESGLRRSGRVALAGADHYGERWQSGIAELPFDRSPSKATEPVGEYRTARRFRAITLRTL